MKIVGSDDPFASFWFNFDLIFRCELLMEEIPFPTTWDVFKNPVNHRISTIFQTNWFATPDFWVPMGRQYQRRSVFQGSHDVTGATESPKLGWVSSKANGKDGVVNAGKFHKIGGLQQVYHIAVLITTCDYIIVVNLLWENYFWMITTSSCVGDIDVGVLRFFVVEVQCFMIKWYQKVPSWELTYPFPTHF